MLLPVLIVSTLCGIAQSSGIGHVGVAPAGLAAVGLAPAGLSPVAVAPPGVAPVVTAASSQYFERTYNRLVAAPPIPLAPSVPLAPPVQVAPALPVAPVIPVAPRPQPVFVPVANNVPVPGVSPQPVTESPSDPNVAIAVATAHAAAPVATILLPPYPFGLPPGFAFVPPQPNNVPAERPIESTTPTTTRQTEATTTEREPDTTPVPSNSDNSFVQALPSNQDINFKLYGPPRPQHWSQQQPLPLPDSAPSAPRPQQLPLPLPAQRPQQWPQQQPLPSAQPRPQQQPWPQKRPQAQPWLQSQPHPHVHFHAIKPQKLKTLVEVVKAPLAYIAPPPLVTHEPHRHIKIIKHVYGFVPESSAKIIIRPVSTKIRAVRVPAHLPYKGQISARNVRTPVNRITEPTTFSPFNKPNTKPPRV
ncbi:hypothetical protein O3G_MSEX002203 [Manduca sexta]|uniref:Uncharacterized protein n=1 Tax=Manduca sexta TaxID=7130 RepID=A0A921YP90_MANSE|nr:hypothetical protein O3G_MSEX002203 [Manduca sexta]